MGDEEVLEWKRAVDRENKNYFQDNLASDVPQMRED